MNCFISNFIEIKPSGSFSQNEIMDWLCSLHEGKSQTSLKPLLEKIGCKEGKIEKRLFEMETDLQEMSSDKKTEFIDKTLTKVFDRFYEHSPLPSDLIHVSCTAYVAPSGAQRLVSKRNAKTRVTNAYHMGCYGSIPALRMAMGFLHMHQTPVDIAHTELCSLHLHSEEHSLTRLIIHSLFADGFIKYTIGKEEKGFKLLTAHEEIIPNSADLMFWGGSDWGESFFISKEVPKLIKTHVKDFVDLLASKTGVDLQNAIFAIHPGGPKIVNQITEALNLEPFQVNHSHFILRSRGNMSSATLPHIWQEILNDKSIASGTQVISLAFGPGITITGTVFEKCG